ncbi:MAG: hypothetical protein QM296_07560 [Bacillota bacterium]|nr:hypothetical protein [Bacillota bacterium]
MSQKLSVDAGTSSLLNVRFLSSYCGRHMQTTSPGFQITWQMENGRNARFQGVSAVSYGIGRKEAKASTVLAGP